MKNKKSKSKFTKPEFTVEDLKLVQKQSLKIFNKKEKCLNSQSLYQVI